MNDKLEAAKSWLGGRWLLAKPQRPLGQHSHVRVSSDRWHAVNERIAKVLEGALHV